MSQNSKEGLKRTLDEAEWSWIEPLLERESVIVVSQDLELLSVAEKVADDDKAAVTKWIADGHVTKPSPAQIAAWQAVPEKRFLTVVVQPFVLIQEKSH